jgi:hypothetical protein
MRGQKRLKAGFIADCGFLIADLGRTKQATYDPPSLKLPLLLRRDESLRKWRAIRCNIFKVLFEIIVLFLGLHWLVDG